MRVMRVAQSALMVPIRNAASAAAGTSFTALLVTVIVQFLSGLIEQQIHVSHVTWHAKNALPTPDTHAPAAMQGFT
jgi:hypothetical protein